ncbi:unnamed protein product [Ilex paraguariensis]|uniref:PGG domain-containing protein n=2 Tax=Ilex paraguariensis TaxID=185542 RepID=A0ABC8TU17_9AQUA
MHTIFTSIQTKSISDKEREIEKKREKMRLLSLLDEEKEEELQKEKAREFKLYEAAMKGTVTSLLSLLHEDPLIFNRATPSSISDSPLHVSALLGHLEFTKELLSRKPELVKALNSDGSSALHVAAAKGYVEIVKELLVVNPDMGFVLDHSGRTPLHLAAIKGRVGVLTELIRVKPEATRKLTRWGETCLHLCVKYNRLEALKVLVESLKKDDQFVNWKDENGSTILHLAVANKQVEIIKFLLIYTGIEINTRNAKGSTAIDILSQGPRDLRDMEIKHCLHHGRTSTMEKTPSVIADGDTRRPSSTSRSKPQDTINKSTKQQPKEQRQTDWLGRKRSALMIVASLLATVAFQAGLSPPGGLWQNDELVDTNGNTVDKPHEVGQSIMAYNNPKAYGQFMIFNAIAFLASLSIILLQISGLPLRRRRWMWTQMVTTWIAITAQTGTYFIAFLQLTPSHVEGTLFHVTRISVMGWLSLMAVVLIGNVIRVVVYFLRKYGCIQGKEWEVSVYTENNENEDL